MTTGASAFKATCGDVQEADPDNECVSWSWDDTLDYGSHTRTNKGSLNCKEHVTGSASFL